MSPALIAAAVRLADALSAENAALAALDIPRAASMLAEKTQAADQFVAARALAALAGGGAIPSRQTVLLAEQLCGLAEENRRLLERALVVQRRVIGLIARAAPASAPAIGYGRTGRLSRRSTPLAIISRA